MPKGAYDHQPRLDLAGQSFGDWTVLRRGEPRGASGRRWLCRCACGTEREVESRYLRNGQSKGCGCRREERRLAVQTKHGMSNSVEYSTWKAIWQRCTNPTTTKWELYGGRGIKVCDRWLSFDSFFEDMGPRPVGRYSIERRDGDGDYSPENCYWAEITQQNRNTSRNHYLEHDGERLTVAEWAERQGLSYGALSARLRYGWSIERALTAPPGRWASRSPKE